MHDYLYNYEYALVSFQLASSTLNRRNVVQFWWQY